MDEILKFVGTYLTEELYYKFKMQNARKGISASKALLSLIMVYTKNVKLEEAKPAGSVEETLVNNAKTESD